jgi:hypothetical protein
LQAPLEPWCYWLQHFAFVTSFVEWAESIARRKLTAYAIMEGLRTHARTYRPNDDRDAIRAWDHAFRDGATMGEMEAALASVGETLRRMA